MAWTVQGDSTASPYRQEITAAESQFSGSGHDVYWLITKDFSDEFRDTDEASSIASGGATLRICTSSDGTTGRLAIDIIACVPNATGSSADILIAVEGAGFDDSTSGQKLYAFWGGSGNTQPAASATYGSEAVYPSHMVAMWEFESDPSGSSPQLVDRTGNSNDGTSQGSMTSGDMVTGRLRNSWDFDDSDDYVDVTGGAWESDSSGSIVCWGEYASNPGTNYDRVIFSSSDSGDAVSLLNFSVWNRQYSPTGPKLSIVVYENSTKLLEAYGGTSLSVGSAHHMCVTQNTAPQLYLNGSAESLTTSGTSQGSWFSGVNNIDFSAIGAKKLSGSVPTDRLWDGWRDSLLISDQQLSSDWVLSHYNNTKPGSTMFAAGTFTDGTEVTSNLLMGCGLV